MLELLAVSILWAFSFGITKTSLAGLSPHFISFARLALAGLVFLPFFRPRGLPRKMVWRLLLCGALQYGLMYIAYNYSFQYLKSYEVALFTIFTPIYVTLINDAMQRRLNPLHLITALVAVAGTAVVQGFSLQRSGLMTGFLIVQVSNLGFAFGQIYYRRVMAGQPDRKDVSVFALLYLGGAGLTAVTTLLFANLPALQVSPVQVRSLLYLGLIASGLGFFLWNSGARKVNAGTLAIFNDLKIPLAITVSLVVFGEKANLTNLLIGGAVILIALVLNELGKCSQARMMKALNPTD